MPSTHTAPTDDQVIAILESFLNGHAEWQDPDGTWAAQRANIILSPAPGGYFTAVISAVDAAEDETEFILALEPNGDEHWLLHKAFVYRSIEHGDGWSTFAIAPAHTVDIDS